MKVSLLILKICFLSALTVLATDLFTGTCFMSQNVHFYQTRHHVRWQAKSKRLIIFLKWHLLEVTLGTKWRFCPWNQCVEKAKMARYKDMTGFDKVWIVMGNSIRLLLLDVADQKWKRRDRMVDLIFLYL